MKYLIIPLLLLCGCTPANRPSSPSDTHVADDIVTSGLVIVTVWSNGDYIILPECQQCIHVDLKK